jgi:RimJ/RimL family protein N-acetyltransferase
MEEIIIRKANMEDLPQILPVYERARKFMAETGNGGQWGKTNPPVSLLEEDIAEQRLYVLDNGGHICAAFALLFGAEPTYQKIDGAWLDESPYATIHRGASDGTVHGVMARVFAFCEERSPHLRVDTHEKNLVMRHLIEKAGFRRCGIIHIADGTPRIAYEKTAAFFSASASSSPSACSCG